jgi:hypothetical protein
MSRKVSPTGSRSGSGNVLASLTLIERGVVLDALLVTHPELSNEAEALASGLLLSSSAEQVAFEVELAVTGIPLEDLAARAGRVPGRGYVHETDAAWGLIEEALAPFMADLGRRIALGFGDAAATVAVGIVAGLYRVREPAPGSVLAYAGEDAPSMLAAGVLDSAEVPGLAIDDGVAAMWWPEWDDLL